MVTASLVTVLLVFASHAVYSSYKKRLRCNPDRPLDLRGCTLFVKMNENKAWVPDLEGCFVNQLTAAGARILLLPEGDPYESHDKIIRHAPYRMLLGDLVTVPITRTVGNGKTKTVQEVGADFQLVVKMVDHGQTILEMITITATMDVTQNKKSVHKTEMAAFEAMSEDAINHLDRAHWFD